jgi:hypothetical protein
MTKYFYKNIFSDSDMIILMAALINIILHCENQLDKG